MTAIVRTLIVSGVLAGLVVAGYVQIRSADRDRLIAELQELNEKMAERIARGEQMIGRLSRTRRLAHLLVGEQPRDEAGRVIETTFEFIELDDGGGEIDRQTFTVPGSVVYVDAMTVRFDPEDVAAGHPLRGRTLVLLRRVFSEQLAPVDGFAIDTPGAIPPAYAVDEMSRFEQEVWAHFWDVAGDGGQAARMGVRVAQGEAVYKPFRSGDRFELSVESVGGLSLTPLEVPSPAPDTPEAG